MRDIYDIFNARQEEMFDLEFNEMQESYDELEILEKKVCVTLEELVYNNPEKKKLSVLIEEVEANVVNKTNSIIDKLKEQMQKILQWLTNMFKHYEKAFAEGANFVKNNNLNQCMVKIKSKNMAVNVNCHPSKLPFNTMKNQCLRMINIDKWAAKLYKGATGNALGDRGEEELQSGDKTETYLENLLKQFKFSKEDTAEINISNINIINVQNNLLALPDANKELERMKTKVQRLYNQLINKVRQDHRNDKNEKQMNRGTNQISHINGQLKRINERIRAYAKIMTMVFKEDYNLAKLIVTKATGQK